MRRGLSEKRRAFAWLAMLSAALVACGEEEPELCPKGDLRPICNGGVDPIWDLPDGGEIRVEYLENPVARIARATAFFVENQDTPQFEMPTSDLCTNIKTNLIWPWAESAGRVYADVGSDLRISSAGTSMLLTKTASSTKDFIGRSHDTWYRFMDGMTPVEDHVPFNGSMNAAVGGDSYEIFMPAIYHMTTYAVADGVELRVDQDYHIEWEMPDQDYDGNLRFFVIFVQPGGAGWTHICIGDNRGAFTIPASAIAELPSNGTMIHGVLMHEVVARGGRRFHLVGSNCLNAPFNIVR